MSGLRIGKTYSFLLKMHNKNENIVMICIKMHCFPKILCKKGRRKDKMIQSTNDAIQILETNTSDIVFANDELRTRSATCRGWLNHTEGTSQYTILGSGNCNQANVYDITFTGNVSGETAGPVEIALKENGSRVVGASANATVVVGEYTNITIKKRISLCPRENVTLTIGSVSAISGVTPAVETVAPSIKNANIIIEPVRF